MVMSGTGCLARGSGETIHLHGSPAGGLHE